jgi:hypothetical protein
MSTSVDFFYQNNVIFTFCMIKNTIDFVTLLFDPIRDLIHDLIKD